MPNIEGNETKTPLQYYYEAVASRGAEWWAHRISTPHNFSGGFEIPQLLPLSADLRGDFLVIPENEMLPLNIR